eukprot:jgi/Tetstr1/459165/TSEL_004611.t1
MRAARLRRAGSSSSTRCRWTRRLRGSRRRTRSQRTSPCAALDAKLERLVRIIKLEHLLERQGGFGAVTEWEERLSLGEQQRLGMARMFYHRPYMALLDECTNAMSTDVEAALYGAAVAEGITLVTISQRTALLEFHARELRLLDGAGAWELRLHRPATSPLPPLRPRNPDVPTPTPEAAPPAYPPDTLEVPSGSPSEEEAPENPEPKQGHEAGKVDSRSTEAQERERAATATPQRASGVHAAPQEEAPKDSQAHGGERAGMLVSTESRERGRPAIAVREGSGSSSHGEEAPEGSRAGRGAEGLFTAEGRERERPDVDSPSRQPAGSYFATAAPGAPSDPPQTEGASGHGSVGAPASHLEGADSDESRAPRGREPADPAASPRGRLAEGGGRGATRAEDSVTSGNEADGEYDGEDNRPVPATSAGDPLARTAPLKASDSASASAESASSSSASAGRPVESGGGEEGEGADAGAGRQAVGGDDGPVRPQHSKKRKSKKKRGGK